jgi:HlyD family secretion protein
MKNAILLSVLCLLLAACGNKDAEFDASGTFETDEIIISAEATGKIIELNIREGDSVAANQVVGSIDPVAVELQRQQIDATETALQQKTVDPAPQIAILESQISAQKNQVAVLDKQLAVALTEQKRISNLVKSEAAPAKQLDDINGQVDIVRLQIEAALSQIKVLQQQVQSQRQAAAIQNRAILSERLPLDKRRAQVDDQLSRTKIINPASGTVLVKYAERGEITTPGKAIYKLGDIRNMTLRTYISGRQLSQVALNQQVTVLVDDGASGYREYTGTVTGIADKAEFTPKTIQTKDERANLVYAIKVAVQNDGMLKIGQYGEVLFSKSKQAAQ